MRLGTLVALVAFLGLLIPGASNAERGWTPKDKQKIQRVVVKKSRTLQGACPGHVAGLTFYRNRFITHSLKMGDVRVDFARPRTCERAIYLADRWERRAYRMRVRVERWQARQQKLAAARQAARENVHPKWIALRLLDGDREQWGCLMYIVGGENMRMDPTLDFGGGHGNVYEAYGIPQANPGTKMASAGPDWRTNPETQLRWMIGYCRGRYGSVCGAAYHRRTQGWY